MFIRPQCHLSAIFRKAGLRRLGTALVLALTLAGADWMARSFSLNAVTASARKSQAIRFHHPDNNWGQEFRSCTLRELVRASQWSIYEPGTWFATITVTTTADAVAADGACSLREAIQAANTDTTVNECVAGAGPDTIQFALGAGTPKINVLSPLPTITQALEILGNTGGSTRVQLDGASAAAGTNGLVVNNSNVTIIGLVISNFSQDGILITSGGEQIVQDCRIGTDASGTIAQGNDIGIAVVNTANFILVGTDGDGFNDSGEGNLISGNASSGILIRDAAAGSVTVAGNFIGTNAAGTASLPNSDGIFISNGASNNIIGTNGSDDPFNSNERNIISGNNGAGVLIDTASDNIIAGNYIGLDASGAAALPNDDGGIIFNRDVVNTRIGTDSGGGFDDTERNVISGNNVVGVNIFSSGSTNNLVAGNYIGLNAAGNTAIPNTGMGLLIDGAPNTIIGGPAAVARNVISGNGGTGVEISNAGATNNSVLNNIIGRDVTNTTAIPNNGDGILISGASNNVIGLSGASNVIASNLQNGIRINSGTGNLITSNSIFGNSGLGIDLAGNGVTPNDTGDADTGANNLQNFPVINSITSAGIVSATLDSDANITAQVEFFASATCDPTGFGEGEVSLGVTNVMTDAAGSASFNFSFAPVAGKPFITTTASASGDTSEFSTCQRINTVPSVTAMDSTREQGSSANNVTIATVSDPDQPLNTLTVQIEGGPMAMVNGVTLGNLTVDASGLVRANIVVDCMATSAAFALTMTDSAGEVGMATLNITVVNNQPPVLGTYPNGGPIIVGTNASVIPNAAPTDQGAIQSITAGAPGFAGTIVANVSTGEVNITNAGPAGIYTVTVMATDNCGLSSNTTFQLSVIACSPLVVNSLGDSPDASPGNGICADSGGQCTLRAAIQEANALACGNTINFSVNGTISLTSALPDISANVTLNGPGAALLTVQRGAAANFRIFTVPPATTVTINGLTILNGNAPLIGGGGVYSEGALMLNNCVVTGNTAIVGGGVLNGNSGGLTMTNCTVSNNVATGSTGGGIQSLGGSLTITGSTVSGNSSNSQGGGLDLQDTSATLTNCTISGNSVLTNGIGSAIRHVTVNLGLPTVTMINCTVTNNNNGASGAIFSGSVADMFAFFRLKNTLVAANSGGPNFEATAPSALISQGNNLDSDGSSGFTNGVNGDLVGTAANPINAHLAPLSDNGGPTQTHALRCDSPAIDAGTSSGAPLFDQRAAARNADGNGDNASVVDIGAFEVQKLLVTNTNNTGAGSLRQALADNDLFGGGLIAFNIAGAGVKSIATLSTFGVNKTVNIDGYTQPGSSRNTLATGNDATILIELNGASAGSGSGFVLTNTAGCSCVRGLAINRYGLGGAMIVQGDNTWINGNFIGTNATGTAALANGRGITVLSTNNQIGTNGDGASDPAERNLISGNTQDGLLLNSPGNNNLVWGNYIGTNAAGTTALGNGFNGIALSSAGNQIGGALAGSDNLIAFNGQNGVSITTNAATGNQIRSNAIFGNGGLGIDLGNNGLTANDAVDPDTGPNNQQNFPLLNSVTSAGVLSGSLDSAVGNTSYPVRVEFFANTTCDASGNGEGEILLGAISVNAPGNFSFNFSPIPGKSFITATAIDAAGNTSEFSACKAVNTLPTITPLAISRQQGSPASNSPIASVTDPDQSLNTLSVLAAPLTGTGITINNLAVNSAGQVTADIVASCTATTSAFTLMVTDNSGEMNSATLTVNVTANTLPQLSYSMQTVQAGQALTIPPAMGPADNGSIASIVVQSTGSYTGGITVNASTGEISLTNAKPAGTHSILMHATDNCGATTDAGFNLTVTCPTIMLSPAALPNGTTGSAYSQPITATGGTAPYTFAITAGTLPAGVTLSSGGSLNGSPSQSGTFTFSVSATDANGCAGSQAYTLIIACPPFLVSVTQPAGVIAGQNFTADTTVTNPCPDASLNTTVTVNTPANTTFQSLTVPSGWTCTTPAVNGTGPIGCSNSSFPPGFTGPARSRTTSTFSMVFKVNAGTPSGTSVTTTVNVTGTAAGLPANSASGSANSTVANQADLAVSQTAPATAISGGDATFNITVTNGPASLATAVTLTNPIPANTTFRSFTSPAGWTCTMPALGGTGTISCTAASLAASQTADFALTVRLDSNIVCDTTISNTATAQSSTPDPTPGNNFATAAALSRTQSDLAVSVAAPATVTPDVSATYIVTVTNAGLSSSFNTILNDALPVAFSVEVITTSVGTCSGIGTNTVSCNLGTLAVGTVATITIQVHVPQTCQPTAAVNTASVTSGNCLADPAAANNSQTQTTTVLLANLGPGACLPTKGTVNGTKPGSILFAGLFTSGATGGGGDINQNNTRVNLTNTHPTLGVIVHMFFVDGATCSIADSFLCLTPNQTSSFFMSDLDPGTSGYMMIIAVDGPPGFAGGQNSGCPISFNYLIGNANIKFTGSPRRDLDLESESTASEFGSPVPTCDPNKSTAELIFDGSPQGYNQLPAVLAMDNIPSRADGNETILMFARIDGNWATGLEPVGPISGLLYDDAEKSYSFSFNVGTCLFRSLISNSFPRTTPRFEQAVPAGRSGWMKFWSANGAALVGAMHVRNDNAQAASNAFEGGHNLHVLRLLPRAVITVPVFPPSC